MASVEDPDGISASEGAIPEPKARPKTGDISENSSQLDELETFLHNLPDLGNLNYPKDLRQNYSSDVDFVNALSDSLSKTISSQFPDSQITSPPTRQNGDSVDLTVELNQRPEIALFTFVKFGNNADTSLMHLAIEGLAQELAKKEFALRKNNPGPVKIHGFILITNLEIESNSITLEALKTPSDVTIFTPEQSWGILWHAADQAAAPFSPPIHMVSDAAIDDPDHDLLGFNEFAGAIYNLIDNPNTKTPLTMAINARWGMGKSSLASLVRKRLDNKPAGRTQKPHVTYWFNAWQHDEADKLAAAFISDIARKCHARKNLVAQWLFPLPSNLASAEDRKWRRLGILSILILFVAGILGVAEVGNVLGENSRIAKDPSIGTLLLPLLPASLTGAFGLVRYFSEFAKSIGTFVASPGSEANSGSLDKVRNQLKKLIQDATPDGSKFVVFIDDLERCRDTRAIDVLEVVNQLLCFENVVTIIVADLPSVSTAAEIKYEKLAERYDPVAGVKTTKDAGQASFGRMFLQKFIQLQFDLPVHPKSRIEKYITSTLGVQEASKFNSGGENQDSNTLTQKLCSVFRQFLEIPFAAWFSISQQQHWLPDWLLRLNPIFRSTILAIFWPLFLVRWSQRLGLKLAKVDKLTLPQFTLNRYLFGDILASLLMIFIGMFLVFSQAFWAILIDAFISDKTLNVVGYGFGENFQSNDPMAALIFCIGATILVQLYVIGSVWWAGYFQRSRNELAVERFRKEIVKSDISDQTISDEKSHPFLSKAEQESIVTEEKIRKLESEPGIFQEAFDTAFSMIDVSPRNIKRVLNRLRLLIYVLNEKDFLGGYNLVEAGQIGKWVALQERWPEIATKIKNNPNILKIAESGNEFMDTKNLLITLNLEKPEKVDPMETEEEKINNWHNEHVNLLKVLCYRPYLYPVIGYLTQFDKDWVSK